MGGRVEEAARGKRRKREREINVRWNVGVRASDEQNRARVIEVSIYKWTRCPIFYISQSQAGRRSRKKVREQLIRLCGALELSLCVL